MIKATLKKLSRRQLDKQKIDAVKAEIAGPRRSASAARAESAAPQSEVRHSCFSEGPRVFFASGSDRVVNFIQNRRD